MKKTQAKPARQGSASTERKCFCLDSSAVLNDFAFAFSHEASYFVTPEIFLEFRDLRSRHLCENALRNGILSLRLASENSLAEVEKICIKKRLRASKADKSIVALALDLRKSGKKPQLVSDDFAVQNLCSTLKIPFASVIRGKIKQE